MKTFRQFALLFLFFAIALNLYAVKRYELSYPFPLGPQLDRAVRKNHLKAITEQNPQIVLVGDSTLTKGVDPAQLAEGLDTSVYSIGLPGSASTLWYLIVKNNVVQAPVPPKYLLIFFRDSMLTMPGYRVQGQYLAQIDEYATPKDQILIERAFVGMMSPLEQFAEAYIPIYTARWQIRDGLEARLRYTPTKMAGCDIGCTDAALSQIFGDANTSAQGLNDAITSADSELYTPRSLDFENQVDKSFLPELINLSRAGNIQLVLIRIKTFQFAQPFPDLDRYMNDLKAYAESNDVIMLDFADDPRLTADLYMDILHLNDQGKVIFTDILAETLKPLLH